MELKYKELGEILYIIKQIEDVEQETIDEFIEYLIRAKNGSIEINKENENTYEYINPKNVVIHGAVHSVFVFSYDSAINNPLEAEQVYTLKDLIDKTMSKYLTVIVESEGDGFVYRYTNFDREETRIIGKLEGYN